MMNFYPTKTEVNKMKRMEVLRVLYEQDKNYFEHVNGCDKEWSSRNSFEKYCENHSQYTVKELREKTITVKA